MWQEANPLAEKIPPRRNRRCIIKLSIGKWFKRQILGNKPITLGSLLDLAISKAGYDDPGDLILGLALGLITVKDLEGKFTASIRSDLRYEIAHAADQLKEAASKL